MALGPKEQQRRDLQAARFAGGDLQTKDRPKAEVAKGSVQKTRTASPSTKAEGSGPPEKPPLSAAAAGAPPGGETTFLVKAPRALLARLEKARAQGGFRSRNDAVVAILDAGAPK